MRTPITTALRSAMGTLTFQLEDTSIIKEVLYMDPVQFADLCDAIDSVHAHLERQYESVKAELDRVLGEMEVDDG